METIIFTTISFALLLGTFYYLFWVKIETVAKPLVGGIIIIATLYVGYDLLITVFSYGTWAVFFKKLVGSIIIAFPISYFLYWLEQFKKRNNVSKKLNTQARSVKSIFKNPLEKNIGTSGVLVAVILSFIIPIALMTIFNDYYIVFNGIALLIFIVGYGFYLPFKEKKELHNAKNTKFERLLSLGWSKEIANKRAYGENPEESHNNPLKEVQTNPEVKTNNSMENLAWEYGISTQDPIINFKFYITKSFEWFTNRRLYTKIAIVFVLIIIYTKLFYKPPYQSNEQYNEYNDGDTQEATETVEEIAESE